MNDNKLVPAPLKDVFSKQTEDKPKLLANNLIKSIKVGNRTKMILKDSLLGQVCLQLDSLVDRHEKDSVQKIKDRIDNKIHKTKEEQQMLFNFRSQLQEQSIQKDQ